MNFKLTADPLAPGIPSVPGFPCKKETKQVNTLPKPTWLSFVLALVGQKHSLLFIEQPTDKSVSQAPKRHPQI